MKLLFLDESGDHNLRQVDPLHPIFVLGGCIIDQTYYQKEFESLFFKFKSEFLGNKDLILHYADYTRNRKGFEKMSDEPFRKKFYQKLNHIIQHAPFTLLACIIDKIKHKEKYGILASDPYHFSLEIIIERFAFLLQEQRDRGMIIAESRNNQLDNALELAYLSTKLNGTSFLTPTKISSLLDRHIHIKKKEENISGLQLADSVVTPISRKYLNRRNFYIDYEIIKKKYRKNHCGKYRGFGLVMLPK